jgi:hypothetical protein
MLELAGEIGCPVLRGRPTRNTYAPTRPTRGSLQVLLSAIGHPQRRAGILSARDTESFRRRKITQMLDLYRVLSMGDALLPPPVMRVAVSRKESRTESSRRRVHKWVHN